jgi:frataxin-like iron-binding protein CyaY
MPREQVWIENQLSGFSGFGYSECNWVFKPSGTLVGESVDEMQQRTKPNVPKSFLLTFVPNTSSKH